MTRWMSKRGAPRRPVGPRVGAGWLALWLAFLFATGCAGTPEPIFGPPDPALAWPPPPAAPRIRFRGELRTSADLKAPRGFFAFLGGLLGEEEETGRMYGPKSVAVTPDGRRVWIADSGGRCLHLFELRDRTYRQVRRAGDSTLLAPAHVALGPEGSIYVCDAQAAAVYRLSAETGKMLSVIEEPAHLVRPVAAGYDFERSTLFVVDVAGHDIKVFGADGDLRGTLGRRGAGPGELNFPTDVCVRDGLLWIVDCGNQRVQAWTRDGRPVQSIGQRGNAPGDLALPKSLALDSEGHLYVVDARFENVQIFDRQGRLLLYIGGEGVGPGQFWLPGGIFIDSQDRIWICDTYNGRIQVFDYLGRR